MLDPWVELPGPMVAVNRPVKVGKPLPFDLPEIAENALQP